MERKQDTAASRQEIRINKYLSEAGVCSRREADRLIASGRITVDGRPASAGDKVCGQNTVCLDGREIEPEKQKVLLLFYKPVGIVCSAKKQGKDKTITEYLKYPVRIYPAGRLDKDSEGLLLLTNEGELANDLMRARNYHEKEYEVTVNRPFGDDFLQGMSRGVPILDTVTRPCRTERLSDRRFRIILTQGLNRQIRRMCEYFGYRVVSLKRVRIMNLTLGSLKPGEYRAITAEERKELERGMGRRKI